MTILTTTLTRSERSMLDRAVRHLSETLDIDTEASDNDRQAILGLWAKLTESYTVNLVEVSNG